MAFIWTDKRQNDENVGLGLASATNFKQFSSARKHSVKKQAFGELKNVIHNQGGATPFKGPLNKWSAGGNLPSAGFGPAKSLCADVLRKQQMKQNLTDAQNLLDKKLKPPVLATTHTNKGKLASTSVKTAVFEDFDDFDFALNTCTKECNKSLEEIWGGMNMIDEKLLDKVINGGDPDSDNEDTDKDQFKWSHGDDIIEEDNHTEIMPLYNWDKPNELPMPQLPDFEFDIPLLEETCF